MDKDIKFPDSHYVGYRQDTHTLTGFMTPEGSDSGAKKRKATVDGWVVTGRSRGRKNADTGLWETYQVDVRPTEVLDNKPMSGFFIEKRLNRGGSWSGGQDKWKIDDPRGFQLEINAGNLQKIIAHTTIVEGEIQGECIWARLKAENVLVPVNTQEYQAAILNTNRASKQVAWSSVEKGDWCVMQNGKEGLYIGQYYIVSMEWGDSHRLETYTLQLPVVSEKPKHVFFDSVSREYFFIASPKVSAITAKGACVLPEFLINTDLRTRSVTIDGHQCCGVAVTSKSNLRFDTRWELVADPRADANGRYLFHTIEIDGAVKYYGKGVYAHSFHNNNRESFNIYDQTLRTTAISVRSNYMGKPWYEYRTHVCSDFFTNGESFWKCEWVAVNVDHEIICPV